MLRPSTNDALSNATAIEYSLHTSNVKPLQFVISLHPLEIAPLQCQFVDYIISHDDANMWMKRATSPELKGELLDTIESEAARQKIKRRMPQGRMMHAPVLNHIENIVKSTEIQGTDCSSTLSMRVFSPAQPLPDGTTSTVLK